ncbi:MAG: DNA repair protein RecN, partial [Pseudomonadota bacterium]
SKSPIPTLAGVMRKLERKRDGAEDQLTPVLDALASALDVLEDARMTIADAQRSLDFDPGAMEAVEERLFALRALARKHGVHPSALPDLAGELAGKLAAIDAGEAHLDDLRTALAAAERAYAGSAAALGATRRAAAARLDGLVTAELAPLRMGEARFRTLVEPGAAGPEGTDRVAFTAAINPGAPEGPIDRIASGGELSRFLLALKVCLAGESAGLTLVFDEIDRGVGGATAAAVGRRLARLAAHAQVLVVTHSPQVAAEGAQHWRIAKSVAGGVTRTCVGALAPAERVDEIARMLAGETVTPEARRAAEALLTPTP